MRTCRDLIDAWPSMDTMAGDLGTTYQNVKLWRHRNAIPYKMFPQIVLMAPVHGVQGVTLELLFALQRGDGPPQKRGRPKKKPSAETRTAA